LMFGGWGLFSRVREWDSNPISATCWLCDLGKPPDSLNLCFLTCKMELLKVVFFIRLLQRFGETTCWKDWE
jgi:hypothetical protein